MEKLVKVVVIGALNENGRLLADAMETIAIYVDPFEKEQRKAILKAAGLRFTWLDFVPSENIRLHWIDAEGDTISILTDMDMDVCMEHGGHIPKVYVRVSAKDEPVQNAAEEAASQTEAGNRAPVTGPLHPNVVCDGCEGAVCGVRYKCAQCPDFDLCQQCESSGQHAEHMMYRLAQPMHDFSSHIERRLSKWLRKRMPRDADSPVFIGSAATSASSAAGGAAAAETEQLLGCPRLSCRRGRYNHEIRRHCDLAGKYTPMAGTPLRPASKSAGAKRPSPPPPKECTADFVSDALKHARTAEKAAAAGFELLSQFSSILDPFGVHLAAALDSTGFANRSNGSQTSAADAARAPAAEQAREQTPSAAEKAATAAGEAANTTGATKASTTADAAAGTSASISAPVNGGAVPATNNDAAVASSSSADTSPTKDGDNASMRSAESMDSVLEALMEATKESKDNVVRKPTSPDVD